MNPRFDQLPFLILRNIFSYFTERELRENILPVCQQWKAAAEEPDLWKTITACGKHTPLPLICDTVRRCNHVHTINVWDSPDTNPIVRQIARSSVVLTTLVLRHCQGLSEDALRYLIAVCKTLRSVDLKETPFKGLIVYEELALAQLTDINLSGNSHMTVSNISTVVLNCRSIEGLHLLNFRSPKGETLDNNRCYFIIYNKWRSLKALSLDCGSLSAGIYPSIFKCRYLRYLCLDHATNLLGEDFEKLWQSLTELRVLKVRFAHHVQGRNARTLFEDGKDVMSGLETFDVTGCTQLGDEGIEAMARCCPKLRTLVLRSCKKLRGIGMVFENCRYLEVLNVAYCHSMEFPRGELGLNALKVLYISKNEGQEAFAERVRRDFPGTVVKICVSEFNKTVVPMERK